MTRSDRLAAAGAVLIACLLPRPSLATDETDEAGARALFAEGRKLAAAGDYAAACPKFEESFRLDPGIGTGFNLADCWEHTGRTASAWGRFLGVAAAAKALGQTERERVARERAAALEPALSRLIVTVTAPAEGLVVRRDEIAVGSPSFGVPVPVDPGPHVVQATAPRKRPFSMTVTVAPSGDAVTVTIPPLEDEVASATPEAVQLRTVIPPPPPIAETPSRLPSVVVGALGLAALAAGGIFGLEYLSANGDAKKLCPTNVCTQAEKTQHDQLVSDARRDRNFSYAGAAVGGVALVTAALLWWRPGPFGPTALARRAKATPFFFARGGSMGGGAMLSW